MKTTHPRITKAFLICVFIVMTIMTMTVLTSCEGLTIVETKVSNAPDVIYVEEFDADMKNIQESVDACNIMLYVKYIDGKTEEIHLTFDMLEDTFKQQLNSEGRHYVSYMYKGKKVEFEVLVQLAKTFTVRFYDAENNIISEQKVAKGAAAVEPTEDERNVEGYNFIEWDNYSFKKVTRSLDIHGIYEKRISVKFYNCKNELINTQYVDNGGSAEEPTDAQKYVPGYIFLRWDQEFTNILTDTEVYGVYINDNTTDTDGDGITDYIEIEILHYDYTKVDTDGNGITDDKEDYDNDGLLNLTEIKSGLKPNDPDTDKDGLTDGDEVDIYWTLPADPDTDGDGAYDGWEIGNGFDPLDYNASFEIQTTISMPSNNQVTIDTEIPGEYINQTIVEPSTNEAIMEVHGSISEPIQYNISASANITISSEELTTAEDPVLMYFNAETKTVESIPVSVAGNEATATITQYGSYVLVDRKVFEEKGQWRDVYTSGNYTSIEIVFVIDDSGSMGPVGSNNDPQNKRLSVAIDLINKLPDGAKIGIVKFDDSAIALTSSLTTSKDTAKGYLITSYFDSVGSTLMYSGVMTGLNLYSNNQTSDDVLRVMILISDGIPEGNDGYNQTTVINTANSKGVQIYTVGLGIKESYFNNTLRPIATGTDATFSYSSDASKLASIYDKIGEKIDMTLDTDADGLADFFESGVDANGNPTLPTINNVSFVGLDKLNPDTDGDGYLDGEEIEIYQYYSDTNPNRVMVWGIVNSDPTDPDSIPAA